MEHLDFLKCSPENLMFSSSAAAGGCCIENLYHVITVMDHVLSFYRSREGVCDLIITAINIDNFRK